jgi:hypothetical protein
VIQPLPVVVVEIRRIVRSEVDVSCRSRTDRADRNESIWFRIGERPQQDPINNAEKGRSSTRTYRERQNAGEREGRMPPQLPEGEVQIARKGVHRRHLTMRRLGIHVCLWRGCQPPFMGSECEEPECEPFPNLTVLFCVLRPPGYLARAPALVTDSQ